MNLLVTAGNTLVPIDRVRCLTNIFTGRTGASLALEAHDRGHTVTLLTSHPETVLELRGSEPARGRWFLHRYHTFEELRRLMADHVSRGGLEAIIHCAAVSDYLSGGIYAPAPHTRFFPRDGQWRSDDPAGPALVDRAAGKVKSSEPELWLRLVRAPKLVDMIRGEWGFQGLLVKFKLEVGVTDVQMLDIAEPSRRHSGADLMVANALEGMNLCAYLGPLAGGYQRVSRRELPTRLIEALEQLARERGHG